MNILDINNNIYNSKNLKEGENIDLIMNLIKQQEMEDFNLLNFKKEDSNNIFNEIKF